MGLSRGVLIPCLVLIDLSRDQRRARVAEDEADLLVEETNKMVTDTLLINTPYANNPRVLRAISNREARVARLLTEFQGMIVDSRTADGGGKGFLDSSKPTAVEFAVVSTLGHLSYRTNDSWRQTYLTLARFNVG